MKVRLAEIPVCGLCSRDGEPIQVTTLEGETWVIIRCPRHKAKLREEAGGDEVVVLGEANGRKKVEENGQKQVKEPTPVKAALDKAHETFHGGKNGSPRQEQVLAAVQADPGKHPREYAEALGVARGQVSSAGQVLVRTGRLRAEGERNSRRWFPVLEG